MVNDQPRMQAYAAALHYAISADATVVDIGAGPGIFSLLACAYGAGSVHCIEPDQSIEVAKQLAQENGYSDLITFYSSLSQQCTPPDKADVIVSDLRGILPLMQNHIPAIVDARHRLLKPGGQLIPQRDRINACLVCAPKEYEDVDRPWSENPFSLNLRCGEQYAKNSWIKARFTPDNLLVEPTCWVDIDYRTVDSPNFSSPVQWTVESSGLCHGLALWFDTLLTDDIGFSNAPGQPELIYGHAFFPWETPVQLSAGDTVVVDLAANSVSGDYVWRWRSRIFSKGDGNAIKAEFDQSTHYSELFPSANRNLQRGEHVPSPNRDMEIDSFILSCIDGKSSLKAIALQVDEKFPGSFENLGRALTRVGTVAGEYAG